LQGIILFAGQITSKSRNVGRKQGTDVVRQDFGKKLTNSNPKIAGRAHYNMAISKEIKRDLEPAIQFAS
jgi:hypothetical protein